MEYAISALAVLISAVIGFYSGEAGGRTVPITQIARLRRKQAELEIGMADLEGLYATLLASHKKLASREAVAKRRATADAKLLNENIPDPGTNPAEYKKVMRLKHLSPNGKGE